jgi:hypothetical protein
MAKKKFENIGHSANMGGGIGRLLGEKPKPEAVERTSPQEKEGAKTFLVLESDAKFLADYARYMAFHKKEKFPIKRALRDAVQRLREAHPEVEAE